MSFREIMLLRLRRGGSIGLHPMCLLLTVTFMNDFPTLAHVFALSKKIKLNMVEERVVTSGFNRDMVTISREQQVSLIAL